MTALIVAIAAVVFAVVVGVGAVHERRWIRELPLAMRAYCAFLIVGTLVAGAVIALAFARVGCGS